MVYLHMKNRFEFPQIQILMAPKLKHKVIFQQHHHSHIVLVETLRNDEAGETELEEPMLLASGSFRDVVFLFKLCGKLMRAQNLYLFSMN